MKIFVVHYKKLVDRKQNILDQFEKHNITDYEFVEIDRDEIEDSELTLFHEEHLSKGKIAVLLSHFYAYKQISENYDNGLIFEDDAILNDNFPELLNTYMNQLPENYDLLFIGDGKNLHISNDRIVPEQYIYEKSIFTTECDGYGAARFSDSYIVNKKCAIELCDHINTFPEQIDVTIDWWINVACNTKKFKVYWAEPTIVMQGSKNGIFESSLNNNNILPPL